MPTDKAREIKKRLLDLEHDKKVERLREHYAQNNLLGSGIETGEVARVEIEYRLKKELIDEENAQPINRGTIPLFKNNSRYKELYRLEKLFAEIDFATYSKIAISIGIIKLMSKYISKNKNHILLIKKTFNKKSKPKWGYKLKAIRKPSEGLKLVLTKHTPVSP